MGQLDRGWKAGIFAAVDVHGGDVADERGFDAGEVETEDVGRIDRGGGVEEAFVDVEPIVGARGGSGHRGRSLLQLRARARVQLARFGRDVNAEIFDHVQRDAAADEDCHLEGQRQVGRLGLVVHQKAGYEAAALREEQDAIVRTVSVEKLTEPLVRRSDHRHVLATVKCVVRWRIEEFDARGRGRWVRGVDEVKRETGVELRAERSCFDTKI